MERLDDINCQKIVFSVDTQGKPLSIEGYGDTFAGVPSWIWLHVDHAQLEIRVATED